MLIDTHAHLFDKAFRDDLNNCIENAQNNNVKKIILVGYSHETNNEALLLTKKHDIFINSCGLHPSVATPNYLNDLKQLEHFIINNHTIAIGECGLDYYRGKDNKENQKKLFIGQIELAIRYNLPIIIHMRDATMDTYNILKEYRGKIRGIMHCYSGSYESALDFIDLNFYISIAGPVTFKNAIDAKKVATYIPIDKLLIETDCPYLAPHPYRGQRNEPSYITLIANSIAELRNIPLQELMKITTENSKKIFNIQGEKYEKN